jgi:hypothetical protein
VHLQRPPRLDFPAMSGHTSLRNAPLRRSEGTAMALDIFFGGMSFVALVLAIRVNRDDIPKLGDALGRWFRR